MIMRVRCLRVHPLPAIVHVSKHTVLKIAANIPRLAKSGVRIRSTMRLILVIVDAMVEHTQED